MSDRVLRALHYLELPVAPNVETDASNQAPREQALQESDDRLVSESSLNTGTESIDSVGDNEFVGRPRSHEKHRTENCDALFVPLWNLQEVELFWSSLRQMVTTHRVDESRWKHVLHAWLRAAQQSHADVPWPPKAIEHLEAVYLAWKDRGGSAARLLALLLYCGGSLGWQRFAEQIALQPPLDASSAVEAFTPLWRIDPGYHDQLFPRLLDAVEHLPVAALVLDLANYLFRKRQVRPHPAEPRAAQLTRLLGALVERLEQFEDRFCKEGVRDLAQARQVSETISLAVSLCDCLTLIRAEDAIGKLYRMLDLGHRRLRIEAAAALARFNEKAGAETLVDMASDPSVRLRVHAYASELGLLDQVPLEFRSEVALAEASLVARLSEPEFFGIAPNHLELVDQRTLAWPGYDEAQVCYLFRYTYLLPHGELQNLGIVGPLVHTTSADLTVLAVDDVYALFAGWQAEHEDLGHVELDPSLPTQAREVAVKRRRIEDAGYTQVQPMFLGKFFEKRLLVAQARRHGAPGTAMADEYDHPVWLPAGNPQRPISSEWAFCWYVGKDLLRSFNPPDELS